MIRRTLLVLGSSLLFPLFLSAQSLAESDPVSMALGMSGAARESSAFALEHNVAAMSLTEKRFAIGVSAGSWMPKISKSSLLGLGATFHFGEDFAIGLESSMLRNGQYTNYDINGKPSGSFSPRDVKVALGISYALSDDFAVGVAAKWFRSQIAPAMTGNAFGADIDLAYMNDGFSATVGVYNLGSKMNYGGSASYKLPAAARVGLGYSINSLSASAQVDYLFAGAIMAGAGLEYGIEDMVFLRAGYHYGDAKKSLPSFASVGLGVKFIGLELNGSYLLASPSLAGSFLFGLGYSF